MTYAGVFVTGVVQNHKTPRKGAEWLLYESPWKLDEDIESSNVKITSKVAAYSLVSYTPSLQEYGSAIIYNIGRMFPVQEVVTLSPLVALKEAKALCVPVAQYSEEGLPTVQLDHSHSRFQVILISLQMHKVYVYMGECVLRKEIDKLKH